LRQKFDVDEGVKGIGRVSAVLFGYFFKFLTFFISLLFQLLPLCFFRNNELALHQTY